MRATLFRRSALLLLGLLCLDACKKKAPPPKREDIIAAASRERRKVSSFANALRKVLDWRMEQPVSNSEASRQALVKELVAKLDPIPAKDLPPEMRKAWKRMLNAWHDLASASAPTDAIAAEGAAAAADLNRMLAANGYPDLRL